MSPQNPFSADPPDADEWRAIRQALYDLREIRPELGRLIVLLPHVERLMQQPHVAVEAASGKRLAGLTGAGFLAGVVLFAIGDPERVALLVRLAEALK
ncbi:MAG: hypothetical protein VX463_19465 [Pseudomonadota bacterium]|nr:hypothetical protein [Pseudomonadota bacterium]